jgi:AraC family transcriptional regulator
MQTFDALVGALDIIPADVESRWDWGTQANYVMVGFPHASLLDLAEAEFDKGTIDLQPPPLGTVDLLALPLAQMLKAELADRKVANELYVDSLITMFGIHILRTYSGHSKAFRPNRGGLPKHKARQMQEFLHENLTRKISVADLAAVCRLSPGHFMRAFTKTFGQSPHQYLLNLRLSRAERLLVASEMKIIDIAHLSGFSTQSHLTTAMKKQKNVTPAQIRSNQISFD